MNNSNLNRYDFIEGQEFIPKTYGVIISLDDKIISVTCDGSLLDVVNFDVEKNIISLTLSKFNILCDGLNLSIYRI